jgi:hypothetical protein
LAYGRQAFTGERQSVPHLLMVGDELRTILEARHARDSEVRDYVAQLRSLAPAS